jgi:hypothetical protein
LAGDCSGRFFTLSREGLKRALFVLCLASTFASAQTTQKPAVKKTAHRGNELTLAGLRPGEDSAAKASRMYRRWLPGPDTKEDQLSWSDQCHGLKLVVDLDGKRKIQVLRLTKWIIAGDCFKPAPWKTGRGLRLGDATVKVTKLYGEPDSRSPSTKDGQPLELWYYAFDWAGPDVPQVMEVLCTKEKDGQPGWVEEITLAAPSL